MKLRITKGKSQLSVLLGLAAEYGFDHIITDKRDIGDIRGVGFIDASGGRHAVHLGPLDDLESFLLGRFKKI